MNPMMQNPCGGWARTPMQAMGMPAMNPHGGGGHAGRGGRVYVVGGYGYPSYYGWPYYGAYAGYPGYYWPYGGYAYSAAYAGGTQAEIEQLRRRINELEEEIARLRRGG